MPDPKATRVFIANFGAENYLWPKCLRDATAGTVESVDLRPFAIARDRAGCIAHAIATKKTERGLTPTAPVASRWFSVGEIFESTDGDVWIHREKEDLWWSISLAGERRVTLGRRAHPKPDEDPNVYELHKPVAPWSNHDRRGGRLLWSGLHAKARTFLFTEATLQQLSDDNAEYALALIEGAGLHAWHERALWKDAAEKAKRGAVTYFDAEKKTILRMVRTVLETVKNSRGQEVLRNTKVKRLGFPNDIALQEYIAKLVVDQGWCCAITGIPLQRDSEQDDDELLASLDRIDSDGHYEPRNLQVVCRFVNRWKNDRSNDEFRRLIALVRGQSR